LTVRGDYYPSSLVSILEYRKKTGYADVSLYNGEFDYMLLTESSIADLAIYLGFFTTEITVHHTSIVIIPESSLPVL